MSWSFLRELSNGFSSLSGHLLLEGILIVLVTGLLLRRRVRSKKSSIDKLTVAEEEELLKEWKPEPLVPLLDHSEFPSPPIIDHKAGKYLILNGGNELLNFSTHNYLGFAGNDVIEEAAISCVRTYGVGSCGPRAFYGTADVHVHLEETLAEFFEAEQACLYSYGFSTIASAIPAYAKKGDIIFVDEAVHFQIQKALDASRSKIKFFKHNQKEHLEKLLKIQESEDKQNPKEAKVSRRFLVVEGIYMNTGSLCDLKAMIELKKRFKLRLFIDETVSFGTIGKTGKGITEHFNIPIGDIDLIMATLEHSMGSIGGFCVGSSYVVEHQTLAGLGYCFSASLPPLFAAAALKGLELMRTHPSMFEDLKERCEYAQKCFSSIFGLSLSGHPCSPVKHLRLSSTSGSRKNDKKLLDSIVKECVGKGIAFVVASYLEEAEVHLPEPSIRLTLSNLLDLDDITKASSCLKEVTSKMSFVKNEN